jgi:signal peptide peptidase SppA
MKHTRETKKGHRLQRIIEKVYGELWLIRPETHASIRDIVQAKLVNGNAVMREGDGICGEAVKLEGMVIDEERGFATIPVGGMMGRALSGLEKGAGAVDTYDITAELREANEHKAVRWILLDIDSPGGMVNGTPEVAQAVKQSGKPVYAFTAGMMASAAYWLGSSAQAIYATPSADVGSIGVYVPFFNQTERLKQMGVEVDLFKSGKFKGMGFPGVPLTEEQRDMIQAEVNDLAELFYAVVRENREGMTATDIDSSTMQGQTFMADAALQLGLIDDVVADKETAIQIISEKELTVTQ